MYQGGSGPHCTSEPLRADRSRRGGRNDCTGRGLREEGARECDGPIAARSRREPRAIVVEDGGFAWLRHMELKYGELVLSGGDDADDCRSIAESKGENETPLPLPRLAAAFEARRVATRGDLDGIKRFGCEKD